MDTEDSITWSTRDVAPAKRIPAWQDFLASAFSECDLDYKHSDNFWVGMTSTAYGDVRVGRIRGSEREALRPPERAKNKGDGVVFSVCRAGGFSSHQAGRTMEFTAGEGAFFHNCLPGGFSSKDGSDYWIISLSAEMIAPVIGSSTALIGKKIGYARPELQLLTAYLNTLGNLPTAGEAQTRSLIGRQIGDLVCSAAKPSGEEAQPAVARGVRAARYRVAVDEIRKKLPDPMLDGARVARAVGVSERYVQRLFEENGSTVMSYIMNERLKAARTALADPARDMQTVSEIAYSVGFSDASHFNRNFRRVFGETPSSVRAGHTAP